MRRSSGNLGQPRPIAWAYMSCPIWYRYAEDQWRRRIGKLAEREGFTIEQWWVDHEARIIDAVNMLHRMPSSGAEALFLPYPDALGHLDECHGLMPRDLGRALNLQVFVLDPVMTIPPEAEPDLGMPAEPRRRVRLLHRRVAS